MQTDIREIFERLSQGKHLTRSVSREVFGCIMGGELPESVTAGLLGAMLVKGESVDELVGAAEAMREKMVRIRCSPECIDTCGTGGDGISTFNVSTVAGIIAAGAGAVVAKHGNRSTTRASGSSEALSSLGIDIDAPQSVVERCLRDARIGYLNAQRLHPAMKHAAPVRRAIPVRTIFNLLGPLTNPAGARRQVIGVPRADLVDLIAEALRELGASVAWVVHGSDGLCDLTITGDTTVAELRDGAIRRFTVTPEEVGLKRAPLDTLRVVSPQASADAMQAILRDAPGPQLDHALLNAGAALVVAGKTDSLADGVRLAAEATEQGSALDTFHHWRSIAGTKAVAKQTAEGRH